MLKSPRFFLLQYCCVLASEGHLSNKAIILWLIQTLESTNDVVQADVIRKTLEIVVGHTMDDL